MNVSFDGINKLIIVNTGVTEISVKTDLYSDWKEWTLIGDNSKYLSAMRAVGGDPISDVKELGSTYFLTNGWRIRPAEWNHRLSIVGNLYTEEGDSPYISTLGSYSVMLISEVSTLVESTIQQLPEIEYSSYSGGVWLDVDSGFTGVAYPIGTPRIPVNNLTDAKSIANTRGFNKFFILGNITLLSTDDVDGYELIGEGSSVSAAKTFITMVSGCKTMNTYFRDAYVTGTQGGETIYENCVIGEIYNTHCEFRNCVMIGPNQLNNSVWTRFDTTNLNNCYSSYDWYVVDYNNSPVQQVYSNFSGKIKFINLTNSETNINIRLNAGQVWFDSSCTTGNVVVEGVGLILNESDGTTVDTNGLISSAAVVEAIDVTIGPEIQYSSYNNQVTIDVLNGYSGITYPIGTPSYPVNNLDDAKSILNFTGLKNIHTISELTITSGQSIDELTISSDNWISVIISSGVSLVNTNFEKVSLYGVMGGFWNVLIDCWVYDITNFCGWMRGGSFVSVELAPYTLESLGQSFFDKILPMYPSIPAILTMNTDTSVSFTDMVDTYQINSMTSGSTIGAGFGEGTLILDSSCTGGDVVVNGVATLIDNSTSLTSLNLEGLINQSNISTAVWDEPIISHINQNTTGYEMMKSSYQNIVYCSILGTTGTSYPCGTPDYPVDKISDALIICSLYNIDKIHINGTIVIDGENVTNKTFIADRSLGNTLIISDMVNTGDCYFTDLTVSGSLKGAVRFTNCVLGAITGYDGGSKNCLLTSSINVVGNGANYFTDCDTYITDDTAYKSINVGDKLLNIIRCRGNYEITNKTGLSTTEIDLVGGNIKVTNSCVAGKISIYGISELVDESSVGCTVSNYGLSNTLIASEVWNVKLADHLLSGTTGRALSTASSGGVDIQLLVDGIWNEATGLHTLPGSFGSVINDITPTLKNILGLSQQNFKFFDQIYNTNGDLVSGSMRIFDNASDCMSNINPIAEYFVSALYDANNKLVDYKVILL